MINVAGVLVDPTGTSLPNHEIRITTRQTINNSIEEITSSEFTDGSGNYNFNLEDGWYYLDILLNSKFMAVGDLIVNSGTPTPIDLPNLLKYSDPVEVNMIAHPPFWESLIDNLENSPLTSSRTNRDQMVDTLVHVAEIKSTNVGEDSTERKGTYDIDVKSCDAQVTKQTLVYSDEVGNFLASTGETIKSADASIISTTTVEGDITKSVNVTAGDYSHVRAESITTTGSDFDDLVTMNTTTKQHTLSIMDDDVSSVGRITTSLGTEVHTHTLDDVQYVDESILTMGSDYIKQSINLIDKVYESKSGTKVTSDTHSNTGDKSTKKIVVDDFIVGREGNDLFEVDSETDTVTVRGSFRVTDLQDANGDPITVEDGDTIYQVFQYSDSVSGPWHDDLLVTDYFRRENTSINGVIDGNNWSIPYQFRYDTLQGDPGDTIYIEYQYSPDGATSWTSTLEAGDRFRRERTVTNGVPGPWSTVTSIVGSDGDEIEIRSQYSVDGIYLWHDTFVEGDKFERRARFVNGVIDSAWSDPFKIIATNSYKTNIFKRQTGIPTLPTTGSFNSPVPSGWSDGIPAGNLQLWGSTRIFSEDGLFPQQAEWTPIQAMSDVAQIDVEYSSIALPGNPTDNPTNWHDPAEVDDLWMAQRITSNGVEGDWNITKIRGEDGDSAVSSFKSIVFIRTNDSNVSAPIGGDWNSPVPTTVGWQDGIPSGESQLWSSTRIFTEDGSSPEQALWTTPRVMTDTATLDFEYSSVESPGNPTDNPGNWDNIAAGDDIWLAQRTKVNGVWSAWNISKIKGEDGTDGVPSFKSTVFIRSNAASVSTPVGGNWSSPLPTTAGWSDGVPVGESKLWQSTRIFTEDGSSPQQSVWTTPASITDTAGIDFEFSDVEVSPGNPTTDPANWHNTATSSDIWMAVRKIENGDFGTWEITKIKGEAGTNGIDGSDGVNGDDGISIIFQGTFASHIANPQDGWSYYNSTDKRSYVYYSPAWYQMTIDGVDGQNGDDGLSIDYRGEFSTPPSSPEANWVYKDTDNGYVYIWTGSAWELMVLDGSDGLDGADGNDGLSVFITYHDNAITSTPSTPTGNGTTGGWHTNATSAANWMSQKVSLTANGPEAWSAAIQIAGADGQNGNDGSDGADGAPGIPGLNGSGWYVLELRGGVFPSDTLANADFIAAFGRTPQLNDHLFYVDDIADTNISDGKRCVTPVGTGTPTWNNPVAYFSGDVIVKGTLSAEHMIANTLTGNEINSQTTILAGSGSTTAGINGYDLGTLPDWLGGGINNYANYRFWAGATEPDNANFSVDSSGSLKAYNARFRGTIELIGGSYMTISSATPFGSSSQFLEWTGPKAIDGNGDPIMSSVTEALAVKYFKSNGDAYFGGTLSAGVLRTSVLNTTKTLPVIGSTHAEIGPFTTNGDPKNVVVSFNLVANSTEVSCPTNPTQPLFSYDLECKIGAGSWNVVASGTFNGVTNCFDGNLSEGLSASSTFTHTDTTVDDFSYRVVVTAVERYHVTANIVTQELSLISTEV